MNPFLKWPGGKRWLINELENYTYIDYKHYYEPFVGGGAVFFALHPANATISDINSELINLYIVMRDNTDELKSFLEMHQKNHNVEYYYKIRASKYDNPVERASQMLYLNRTCFNGMYRVNRNGFFNVPIGTKKNFTYDLHLFDEYASCLSDVNILASDFEDVLKKTKSGDLIFADPPYATINANKGFVEYNDKLFTWDDQKRLFEALVAARSRGTYIISTNMYCSEVINMYSEAKFKIHIVKRFSTIAGKKGSRQQIEEALITSM